MKRIPIAAPVLNGREKEYVLDCLETTWISSAGAYIQKFEEEFAKYIGANHALTCSNGTVALHLPLLALGIGPGDEVIVPSLTYIATANSVAYTGATVVFVDCDPKTYCISPEDLKAKITEKTRAVIIVHLYGHPCSMDPIIELCRHSGINLIEDCAESLGGKYKGQMTGSFGIAATFSFFGNKTITTGEGGMVVTNDAELARKMRMFKGQGMDPERRYWHPIIGYNYRMTNIQAAIGLAQLENIEWHLRRRREVASKYNELLARYLGELVCPYESEDVETSCWMYTILIKNSDERMRDVVMGKMAEAGVETRPVFYPMHIMPPHKRDGNFPNTVLIASTGINLPTHGLLTDGDQQIVVNVLVKAILEARNCYTT